MAPRINASGGVLTAVVLVIVVSVKFVDGAYLVVILVPMLVAMMLFIERQYRAPGESWLSGRAWSIPPPQREERVVVPIAGLNRATVQAINVGRSIAPTSRPC